MRLAPFVLASLAIFVASGCQRHEPAPLPPPPPPAAPVSIWGEADSQAIATQFVESALRDSWTSQFRDRNGRAATISVGEISDHSSHAVPVEGLGKAIASALASAGGDKLASAGETSDFVLRGVLGASAGTASDGAATTFFTIDLSLSERTSGDKAWHFAVERPIADR